jgi:hypothetical protein
VTVFCGDKGVVLVKFLPRRPAVSCDHHSEWNTKSMTACCRWVHPTKKCQRCWPPHDNATAHTCTSLRPLPYFDGHLPHSRHVEASDFYWFVPLKDRMQGHLYEDDKALQNTLCLNLQWKESNFCWAGRHTLAQKWKAVNKDKNYAEEYVCLQQYCTVFMYLTHN